MDARAVVLPLALAQFICSYAASSLNVAITAISKDLDTTVIGVQTTITLFTLTMAALMIPGSKLSDRWGRRTCFIAGLAVYGVGALLASLSPGLGLMIFGNSILEGAGSALMIPPVYILVTVTFTEVRTRAKYFGVVSGAGALGAAVGPLIGGLITGLLGWRALFLIQALAVALIIFLARNLTDQPREGPRPPFDLAGAVLSAAGLFFLVLGILQTNTYGWFVSRKDFSVAGTVLISKGGMSPVWLYIGVGAVILTCFFWHLRTWERKGKDPLLRRRLLRNRTANLGLGVQLVQWLTMQGSFFVVSVFLQQVWKYDAIRTGLMLTPASVGILVSSVAAERLARRHSQSTLIKAGFVVTTAGMALLLALVRATSGVLSLIPGLLLTGLGVGVMLTAAVNLVQSSFPDGDQSDISGLSRSVSNLGSSLGTASAGSILVAATHPGGRPFALSLTTLLVITLIGLVIALLIPSRAGP
ncbi:MFS transporter [Pseudofrankia sp. BMG5.37]|nr:MULTISPECIES: MFS transporter [unclassified Pseudofrankia]MDT3439567.1 MFS transporter [Pseudofrankia sp. BMG5.37]OHV48743.1 MFS transporter [Pseudofrankia sp. BMG5.36]